jgi:LmbE family N-acetylglucosaminyl deacetylase
MEVEAMRTWILSIVLLLVLVPALPAQGRPPRVLLVNAHPDDETACSGAVYKVTHDLKGRVDLVVITNGEGGYKYSTLAESIYHLRLTDEATGRRHLPRIRKAELRAAGRLLGLHRILFLDQKDHHYTTNPHEVLDDGSRVWDLARVRTQLQAILQKGHYDAIFTLLPTADTHGHHKGATILTLEAVQALPEAFRPIILGASVSAKEEKPLGFNGLDDYPLTATSGDGPAFTFDRTQSFGFRHALNYKVIVNWVIAAHKSQGSMQLYMNRGDLENYWLFALNTPAAQAKAKALFDQLAVNTYPELTYAGEVNKALPKN